MHSAAAVNKIILAHLLGTVVATIYIASLSRSVDRQTLNYSTLPDLPDGKAGGRQV
jgi:hypothetical protein